LIRRLLLSCGEPSGDLYAGALTRELRAIAPDLQIAGLGGPAFAAAGGELLADYRGLSATGLTEWVGKVPRFAALRRAFVARARAERPDGLVVIDYFGFNARLAKSLKAIGIPVVYYVSPQIWAWRAGRLARIRDIADRMLVIFPFEEAIYRNGGVPVEFVGHPLIDLARAAQPREQFLAGLSLDPSAPTVAILPGSRSSEVSRILPDLVASTGHIRRAVPAVQFVIARAPNLDDRLFALARERGERIAIVEGDTDTVLASADLTLTASGTATVQAALHDTPMVVVYRVAPLEYRIGRRLVTLDTFAMVNLIAERRLVTELIQDAFTPEAVAREAVSILADPGRAREIRSGLADVRRKLGGPGASRRAAQAIVEVFTR
jgi:lipid-A-disaccharide synthase